MAKILLARGAHGDLVRKVQGALTERGFDPQGTDGQFGKLTESAVKGFQQSSTFEPTGQVDVSTWRARLNAPIPTTPLAATDGGIRPAAEFELEAVADASSAAFREDVPSRKLTFATGTGKVHAETFVLSNWGLDGSTADL